MTEIELIVDLHKHTKRQGPGSKEETLKALGFINVPADKTLTIADIGSGTGSHSITCARNLNSKIRAIDLYPEFLEELKK